MLVSHTEKFIYIKTKKTASTSTEALLEKFCVDPKLREDFNPDQSANEQDNEFGIIGARWEGDEGNKQWWNHMPAVTIKEGLGIVQWEDYTKVCNIRNPFDCAISAFRFETGVGAGQYHPAQDDPLLFRKWLSLTHKNPTRGFPALVANRYLWASNGFNSDTEYEKANYTFRYIRYENLKEDLAVLAADLDLDIDLNKLPHYKKDPNKKDPLEMRNHFYDKGSRDFVARVFEHELDVFGYDFDTI